MSSEIRTNLLKSRTGLSTVTLSDTGPVVTGIATFGVTTKIDGGNNVINVGTALTIGHTQGVQFLTQNLHSTGFEVNQVNASGIITASSYRGDGSQLTGIGGGISTDAYGNTYGGHLAGNALTSDNDDNVIIGREAGEALNSGDDNVFIGAHAGEAATSLSQSVLIGYKAGSTGQTGSRNVIIGDGNFNYNNQDQLLSCTFVGYGAGSNQQDSYNEYNTFLGYGAGQSSGSDYDVCIGRDAGNRRSGRFGIFIGDQPGNPFGNYGDMTGQNNIMIGRQTGNASTSGADNTLMGHQCGMTLTTGSNNLVLGHDADVSGATVSNEITLGDANITKFRIPGLNYVNDAGNLGINNSSPNARLEITDTSTAQIRLGYNATKYVKIGRSSSGTYEFFSQENGAALVFGTAESSDGGGAEKVRIDRYGNVGIGYSLPNAKLHIASGTSSAVGDATNPALQIGSSANYRFAIHTTNEQAIIANKNGDDGISFHTKTASGGSFGEALRIHNSGKLETKKTFTSSPTTFVHIGDDQGYFNFDMSDSSGGTDYIRHVKKRFVSKNTYGLTITSRSTLGGSYTKAGEASIKFYYPSAGGGNQAGGQLEFWTNQNGYAGTTEAKRMQIDNGGNIGAPNGNNIYNASDERLKENMVELTNGLDKIKKLKPISFNWKDGWVESLSGKKEYGFGAQTTQVVDEMLVEPFGTEDALLNGETIENPLRVNEKYITPLLVKAIQEQQEQIEILKQQQEQIEILKQENLALRIRVTNLEDN